MDTLLYKIKKLIPTSILKFIRLPYHFILSLIGAFWYRFPSKELTVIAVTGTKGKSTVTEILSHILETDGKKVASLSTIQFKVGENVRPNLYKMTTPGRFFVQRFLRQAVQQKCTHAVLELTSEGAKQFRHKFLDLDALVFTNLTPEHIESHGSFEKYKKAKLNIADQVVKSKKRPRFIVANVDDEHGKDFLNKNVEHLLPYSLKDLKLHTLHKDGISLTFSDEDKEITVRVPLVGLFNVYNSLAAITLAKVLNIPFSTIEKSLRELPPIHGRVEQFTSPAHVSKKITAVVDYAHTPDSLTQLYDAYKDTRKICILGNTGGGRDTWKRPEMGAIAEKHCQKVILTNEDPYDENPKKIVEEMREGMTNTDNLEIVMDRQEAIKRAFAIAKDGDYVIISGKGTDPYIMGPNNTREPWSDAKVVQEELEQLT